jgi:hypothetical protein
MEQDHLFRPRIAEKDSVAWIGVGSVGFPRVFPHYSEMVAERKNKTCLLGRKRGVFSGVQFPTRQGCCEWDALRANPRRYSQPQAAAEACMTGNKKNPDKSGSRAVTCRHANGPKSVKILERTPATPAKTPFAHATAVLRLENRGKFVHNRAKQKLLGK